MFSWILESREQEIEAGYQTTARELHNKLLSLTPMREEFTGLARFLNRTASSPAFATNELGKIYEPGRDFTERAAGLLAIPISRTPRLPYVFSSRSCTDGHMGWQS